MRRALLSALLSAGLLAGAAAPAQAALDASVRNATDRKIDVVVAPAGKFGGRKLVLDPGETLRDASGGKGAVSIRMDGCGPLLLKLDSGDFSKSSVTLGRESDSKGASYAVGDEGDVSHRGVRVNAIRLTDRGDDRRLEVEILACRPPATEMTPNAEESSTWRNVRATVRNSTNEPIDVVYQARTSGPWATVTVAPRSSSAEFGHNMPGLMLGLADCGPTWVNIQNPPFQAPRAKYFDERESEDTGGMDEGDYERMSVSGQSIILTRDDDSSSSKRFTIDVQACNR